MEGGDTQNGEEEGREEEEEVARRTSGEGVQPLPANPRVQWREVSDSVAKKKGAKKKK
jgi:hypothetical protein